METLKKMQLPLGPIQKLFHKRNEKRDGGCNFLIHNQYTTHEDKKTHA